MKTKAVGYADVELNGGFWKEKQALIAEVSIDAVYARFQDTGRINAVKHEWREGAPFRPHIFWDSDVAKWIESAAYVLRKRPSRELEERVDRIVSDIEKNQGADGYFNSYFMVVEKDARWTRRTDHELYCAGHLIEAAVAYYEATGKDAFLKVMCRFADHIEKVFVEEQSAAFSTPGHEEIELALVKLYRCTGERRYLELSRFFIDQRGTVQKGYYPNVLSNYSQDHLPVREQTTAEGHSVRAVYLYAGMADIAGEYDDEGLKNACQKLFENISQKRMYITGGIGSSRVGEAFTLDYDLPNSTAYTESCAALGLCFFAERMSRLEPDSVYADVAERALYNGFLSSVSLDGRSFFYENPLEIDPELHRRDSSMKEKSVVYPITQRKEVFDCSCCPPNITRFIASLGGMLYSFGEDTLFIHHYAESAVNNRELSLHVKTRYPWEGKICILYEKGVFKRIALRIPGWCENYTVTVNGEKLAVRPVKGYVYLDVEAPAEIALLLDMPVTLMEANPKVQEDAGRVAVQRGPVIFCAEAVDNGEKLRDIALVAGAGFEFHEDDTFPFLTSTALRRRPYADLYKKYDSENMQTVSLKLIPYYAFANRGETEMLVWFAVRQR